MIAEIQLNLKGPTFGDSHLWPNLHHEEKETVQATPQKGDWRAQVRVWTQEHFTEPLEYSYIKICLEQQTEWVCKKETSGGGHQEIYDTSEVVPDLRGSDWRDRADNNSWPGASPVAALRESGKGKATLKTTHNISSTVCQKAWGDWSQLEEFTLWSGETKMYLFGHNIKCHVTLCIIINIASQAWSVVMACCGDASLQQALEGWDECCNIQGHPGGKPGAVWKERATLERICFPARQWARTLSSHLNPSENLWFALKKAVHSQPPCNLTELEHFCKE